ncbi:MAG: RusA family crossover junction endodeoxyribonuclease [Bacteroidales bacterium]|jgi:Holliday junction resolvase RusA-like endonuclease
MLKIELPNRPIPWKRAGHSHNFFYDTQHAVKLNIKSYIKQNYKLPKELLSGAIRMTYLFEFKMPKSWSKKKKLASINQPHTIAPDTSNLIKFIEDTFSNFIFVDDKQIASSKEDKIWSDKDQTTVIVEELINCRYPCIKENA